MALLEVHGLHTYYGKIHALKGISLTVDEGEIVTLIGANGAGKTTTLNTISAILRPRQGTVTFAGEDLLHIPPHVVVERGVVQVPEGRRIFARLTIVENLRSVILVLPELRARRSNRRRGVRRRPPSPAGRARSWSRAARRGCPRRRYRAPR